MTTKEFSKLFGMTTCEMSKFLGMSRQGLNEIIQGRSTKPSQKKREAKHDLRELAMGMRARDVTAADNAFRERMKAVEKLFNVI